MKCLNPECKKEVDGKTFCSFLCQRAIAGDSPEGRRIRAQPKPPAVTDVAPVGKVQLLENKIRELEGEVARLKRELASRPPLDAPKPVRLPMASSIPTAVQSILSKVPMAGNLQSDLTKSQLKSK